MVSCVSCGCSLTKNTKSLNITFHIFPKSGPRRNVWISFVSTPGWEPKKANVLCSQHFTPDCFDKTSKLKMRLWPTAVPTIKVNRLKYVRPMNPVHIQPAAMKACKNQDLPGPFRPPLSNAMINKS